MKQQHKDHWKVPTGITLPPEMRDKLHKHAQATDQPASRIVREALRQYFEKLERQDGQMAA
jgi:predicted DNA-binding protein